MKILLTGASGFIGSALVQALTREGHTLTWIQRSPDVMDARAIRGDIQTYVANPALLENLLTQLNPDAIVHLAWASIRKNGRDDPIHYETNLRFTQNLVDLVVQRPHIHFTGVGSQAEYGPLNTLLTPETLCCPTTAYGITKKLAGDYVRARLPQRSCWLRILTAYGIGDHKDKFLPYLVHCYQQGLVAEMSPGDQEWDFLHVQDLARAFRLAIEQRTVGTHVLAQGSVIAFKDLALRLHALALKAGFSPPRPKIGGRPYSASEIYYLGGDSSSFRRLTGWSPEITLEEGLEQLLKNAVSPV